MKMQKILAQAGRMTGKVLITIIRAYQIAISPLLPNACRYEPTCSHYAVQAIEKYGIIKGLLKSLYRILRCNPFSPGGYDPV